MTVSVLSPAGHQDSTCGYCSPPGERSRTQSSHSVGASALNLTCKDYQDMIDRGWRRSGTYCYKPDMRRTCCPQYTIRLNALEFSPTRSQRKVVNRWNRFVLEGNGGNEDAMENESSKVKKPKKTPPFSLIESIHASESPFSKENSPPEHTFEVILEPAKYTTEKYNLYCNYQANIHNDHRNSSGSFNRFLVQSPLRETPIPYTKEPPPHLPRTYGSYHQLYRLDGELFAMAVLDFLPSCVSSVYFMYDESWESFSLGKLSAMREASLAREMHEHGASDLQYLYMGYYVHSCPKMIYKGDYAPSFLLDPETYIWYPLKECTALLDQHRYACFSYPEHSIEDPTVPPELPAKEIPDEDAEQIVFFSGERVQSITETYFWIDSDYRGAILLAIEGLGLELSKRIVFSL